MNNAMEVTSNASRIILSLMTAEIVEDVIFGEKGLLAGSQTPEIIVDTSTENPKDAENFAQKLFENQIFYLDAPISGDKRANC